MTIYIEKNTKIPPLQVSGEVFVFLNTFFTDAAADRKSVV